MVFTIKFSTIFVNRKITVYKANYRHRTSIALPFQLTNHNCVEKGNSLVQGATAQIHYD